MSTPPPTPSTLPGRAPSRLPGPARSRTKASLETAALGVALSALLALRRSGTDRAGSGARNADGTPAGTSGAGQNAATPADIPPPGWWEIVRRVFDEIGKDRLLAVAAGVTFYGLLALFPAIAAFVSVYGLVADPSTVSDQLAALGGVMPDGALSLVSDQVKRLTGNGQEALSFALIISLGTSIWSANAGMKAVFDALNVAYGETERRNFVVLNLVSLGFTAATILFLVAALTGVVVLPIVLKFVGLGDAQEWLLTLARWPALLAVLILALAMLYRFGPSRKTPRWAWISPGATLAGLGWIAFSMLFSWYVSRFGNYNATYGSLGAAIGFMTWLWLSTVIVLVGAELNAETEQQAGIDPKPASNPGQPAR